MKKLVLAAVAALALGTPAMAQEAVRIATEGAYAPWNFLDDSGAPAGFEIDLGNAICEKAALSCEWIINDWDSIIPNLLAGNYDLIMAGMSITEERLATIDFTQNYFPPDPSKFVAAPGSTLDFANLSGARIGVQGGTIQAAYAEANLASGNTVVSFTTADQNMADLMAGNVDTILADGAYLEPVVAASNGAIEFVGEDILIGGGVGAGLRKDDADLKTKIDDALTALKADGTVDTLIAKWFDGKGPYFAE
ncbi:transporter substrate-binding domain-containing protein [Devosia sp. 63-57]|uniref:transporter substrate-binding domain-containing protein n=1 Tax=Devosia sp. 63-57 TaxID=1895751 RepID=UPI00086EA745|nr:transporter substrate-binding domain-containing protein [Devosia sp. 63-57]ODT50812.1 MAG: amino acid ABC transporter [Pelagibacterium sp. SCN 63-126]ODU82427.1 MAG: amino acid ABC transporter [Pelagibacterium sp. SCN 63-17]OJX44526.1 MAG: amino acid ABC transporter [Devosia sp. 63-57]